MKFSEIPEISGFFVLVSGNFHQISRMFIIFCNSSRNSDKISSNFRRKMTNFSIFCWNGMKFSFHSTKMCGRSLTEFFRSERCKSLTCRSRNMLQNAPTLAIVAVHTEENEPLKIWGDLFSLVQLPPYYSRRCSRCHTLPSQAALRIRAQGRPRNRSR